MNWAQEFTHDEQYDQIFETNDEGDSLSLFKMVNYLVDAETDVLLVKIEGSFDASKAGKVNEAEIHMSF